MTCTPLMAGNQKMSPGYLKASYPVQDLGMALSDAEHDHSKCEVLIIPSLTGTRTAQTTVDASDLRIKYGAQDVSTHDNGAYIGEIPAEMFTKLGVTYVVMGHPGRREYHDEPDEPVGAKARKVLDASMAPVLCCGEVPEVRKTGAYVEFMLGQTHATLAGWKSKEVAKTVIAYGPIWAIGIGEIASAEDAQEMCSTTHAALTEDSGVKTTGSTRILYGGPARPDDIKEFMARSDVDDGLAGGASLKADSFAAVATFYA